MGSDSEENSQGSDSEDATVKETSEVENKTDDEELEEPIKDLSSSLKIITYTFSLLLLLTLLSNLYYLTFLNSFSRSLGMINNQYNISFEKIELIEKYQEAFYKPKNEIAESNWKENKLSYPGVAFSRRIDNWGIYRHVKPENAEDEEDEPAVLEKMPKSAYLARTKLFESERSSKIALTKYFRIDFTYPGSETGGKCDGGVILAMRKTDADNGFIQTQDDFDNVAKKMQM